MSLCRHWRNVHSNSFRWWSRRGALLSRSPLASWGVGEEGASPWSWLCERRERSFVWFGVESCCEPSLVRRGCGCGEGSHVGLSVEDFKLPVRLRICEPAARPRLCLRPHGYVRSCFGFFQRPGQRRQSWDVLECDVPWEADGLGDVSAASGMQSQCVLVRIGALPVRTEPVGTGRLIE